MGDARAILRRLYDAAVQAAQPGPAVSAALEATPPGSARVHLIALGKASVPMAAAARAWLTQSGRMLVGGVIITADQSAGAASESHLGAIAAVAGDHPVPGPRSARAAELVAGAAGVVRGDESVLVLLSGGASSLIGAPAPGIDPADLSAVNRLLLDSGLDIHAMNLVRKRLLRWGAGRLAAALAPADVCCLIVSDVIGDDVPTIASGPCSPDGATAADAVAMLRSAGLLERVPPSVRRLLVETATGELPETPKPGDAIFARVRTSVILNNRSALDGAAAEAIALGLAAELVTEPLSGESSVIGAALGRSLHVPRERRCTIRGGETTVTLGPGEPTGIGGRCQELALAAAREIAGRSGAALLAAGTDGRDGPTDAAGAIVDGHTWRLMLEHGRDPDTDLRHHDAFIALSSVSALLPSDPTGTNVADIVITLG